MKYLKAFKEVSNNIQQTFPFKDIKELNDFKKTAEGFQRIIEMTKSDRDFFVALNHFFKQLHDSHTKLGNYPGKKFFKPRGYSVKTQDTHFYLFKNDKNIGKILKIDGQNSVDVFNYCKENIPGTTPQFLNKTALMWMLVSENKIPANLVIENNNKTTKKKIARDTVEEEKKEPFIEDVIEGKIGYLKINHFSYNENKAHEIDKYLEELNKNGIRRLIIDVRGNMGGNSNFAERITGHLIKQKIPSGFVKIRNKKSMNLEKIERTIKSNGKKYKFNAVILVDSLCYSSNEIFISGLRDNNLAILIGEKTGGGSGNPKKIKISFGKEEFEIYISTWRFFRNNGKEIEGAGIAPDIKVKNDIFSNTDEALARAIEYFAS